MATIQETATGQTPLSDALGVGVSNISYQQSVTFDKYIKVVIPTDGFVFWVKATLIYVRASAYNDSAYNVAAYNSGGSIVDNATQIIAPGSLHISTDAQQNEAGSPAMNSIVFTSDIELDFFNDIGPNTLYVGTFNGIRFSFNDKRKFYRQAGLFHYSGNALYSTMDTQLIDDLSMLNTTETIVSNSLPIWLSLSELVPVYSSYAVPENLPPPYAVAHIDPTTTAALQAFPRIDRNGSHWQLAHDTVKFTLYGLNNNQALDFQDYLIAQATDQGPYGIMNIPIIRDEKEPQVEMQILAQKKTFSLEVSYYQSRIQDIVRQLILSATVQFTAASVAI